MAEIHEVIYTQLTTHAGLAALIGSRVHPGQLPQRSTLPALTYRRVTTLRVATRDGDGKAKLARPRFQFDCWAATYATAREVATQLIDALTALPQDSDPRVDVALASNDFDDYEPDPERYRVILDAFVWHEES